VKLTVKSKVMEQPVTIKQLASKTDAKLTGDESVIVTDVSHDSRRVGKGTHAASARELCLPL